MSRSTWNPPPPGGAGSRSSGRKWMVAVAVCMVAVLGWSAPAAAEIRPQTHIDSLYPTANALWACTNGVSGSALPTNLFCRTDNGNTSWYADSDNSNGTGDIRNQGTVNTVLEREYDGKTDLSMHKTANPVFSGPGETDIVYQQGNTGGAIGRTWCNDAVNGSARRCDQQYVRFASHFPSSYAICHETGHAVGLTHGAQANPIQNNSTGIFFCMRTPLPPVGDRAATIGLANGTLGSQLDQQY